MRSRNLNRKECFSSKSTTTNFTNRYSQNTFSQNKSASKFSKEFLTSNSIKKIIPYSAKKKIFVSPQERKALNKFLLTTIPSYKSKTEKKNKKQKGIFSFKESIYNKYNNYHVPILNIINQKQKRKITDIRNYKINIPKGYQLSSGQNSEREEIQTSLDKNHKREKRFYIGHIKEEKSNNNSINTENSSIKLSKKSSILSPKFHNSINRRFTVMPSTKFSNLKFNRHRSSVIVLNKVIEEKEDIEQIIIKNINHMRELERKKKMRELQKKEKLSQEVYEKLNKEFQPVENTTKKYMLNQKKDSIKQNNIIFHDYFYISEKDGFSEKFKVKHKVENRFKKEYKKENIKIPKMSLSDLIEIECLKNQLSKRSKSE